ncbi:MAG: hypothetical protein PHU17_00295 [Candidatus Pacebacteria bacterium]|nr:hypothetical protein [Candidatus Paceibacterota bacterium]MDD4073966.1 hypothetical protein [Candidatus Paceibacterota bacterium]
MKDNVTKRTLVYQRIIYGEFLKDLDLLGQIGKNNIKGEKDKLNIICKNQFNVDLLIEKFGEPIEKRIE